jgi:hypothetical protein
MNAFLVQCTCILAGCILAQASTQERPLRHFTAELIMSSQQFLLSVAALRGMRSRGTTDKHFSSRANCLLPCHHCGCQLRQQFLSSGGLPKAVSSGS